MSSGFHVRNSSSIPFPVLKFKDTAYHFVSATTMMMRCALEAESDTIARHCVAKAKALIDYLSAMKRDENWDLPAICLGQCEMTVRQMSESGLDEFRKRNDPKSARSRCDQNDQEVGQSDAGENRDPLMMDPTMLANGVFVPPMGSAMLMGDPSDWQAQLPEDFYFPELWQVSHLDK